MLLGAAQAQALSIRLQLVRRKLFCWWQKKLAAHGVLRQSKVTAVEPAAGQRGMCWRNSQHSAGQSLQEHNTVSLRALDVPLEKLLGPRVEHLIASQPALLSDTVASALQLPKVRLESPIFCTACKGSGLFIEHTGADFFGERVLQKLRTRALTGLQAVAVLTSGGAGVCAGADALWSSVLLCGAAAHERAGAGEHGPRARPPGTGGPHCCRGCAGQGSAPSPALKSCPPLSLCRGCSLASPSRRRRAGGTRGGRCRGGRCGT